MLRGNAHRSQPLAVKFLLGQEMENGFRLRREGDASTSFAVRLAGMKLIGVPPQMNFSRVLRPILLARIAAVGGNEQRERGEDEGGGDHGRIGRECYVRSAQADAAVDQDIFADDVTGVAGEEKARELRDFVGGAEALQQ